MLGWEPFGNALAELSISGFVFCHACHFTSRGAGNIRNNKPYARIDGPERGEGGSESETRIRNICSNKTNKPMKSKSKPLPKQLFVHRQDEGTDDEYMQPNTKLADVSCENTRVRVGIYTLEREVEVTAEPTIVAEVG